MTEEQTKNVLTFMEGQTAADVLELTEDILAMLKFTTFRSWTKKDKSGVYIAATVRWRNAAGELLEARVFGPYAEYKPEPGDFLRKIPAKGDFKVAYSIE